MCFHLSALQNRDWGSSNCKENSRVTKEEGANDPLLNKKKWPFIWIWLCVRPILSGLRGYSGFLTYGMNSIALFCCLQLGGLLFTFHSADGQATLHHNVLKVFGCSKIDFYTFAHASLFMD
jgi:hypothetical protein